jgi:HSP20 family molecular chaperone IbpA
LTFFESFQEDLERLWHRPCSFTRGLLPTFIQPPSRVRMAYAPRMDVYEKDNTLVFKAELPGLKRRMSRSRSTTAPW